MCRDSGLLPVHKTCIRTIAVALIIATKGLTYYKRMKMKKFQDLGEKKIYER